MSTDLFKKLRNQMVKEQLYEKGIYNRTLLDVMGKIPREKFVSDVFAKDAYKDLTLPIGQGQTISRPIIVARMLQEIDLSGDDKILEIGTGSGYQTAIIAQICKGVVSIEIFRELSFRAMNLLYKLGIDNVKFIVGDGNRGYEKEAPYNKIIISAEARQLPGKLSGQLKEDGKIILPLNESGNCMLTLFTKREDRLIRWKREGERCSFVPLLNKL